MYHNSIMLLVEKASVISNFLNKHSIWTKESILSAVHWEKSCFIQRITFELSHWKRTTTKWMCQPSACLFLPSLPPIPSPCVPLTCIIVPLQVWIDSHWSRKYLSCWNLPPVHLDRSLIFSLCLIVTSCWPLGWPSLHSNGLYCHRVTESNIPGITSRFPNYSLIFHVSALSLPVCLSVWSWVSTLLLWSVLVFPGVSLAQWPDSVALNKPPG